MRFGVLHLHQYASLMSFVQRLPNQDPQVRVFRSWANAPHLSSLQPVHDPFVVNMDGGGT